MALVNAPLLTGMAEGFAELDGRRYYVIPDLEPLDPFLMSLVSDSDHWCFISSSGALTAGRRDAENALFPYETDDRLHVAEGITGPATVMLVGEADSLRIWEPFGRCGARKPSRAIAKTVLGDQVIFEELHEELELAIRLRWATSERYGFVRTTQLLNLGNKPVRFRIVDGVVNLLPPGLVPDHYRAMSNLSNAYRRSERIGPADLSVHTLEALIVDQAIPAESLRATVTWSTGAPQGSVSVDGRALAIARKGTTPEAASIVTGRPGAHLVMTEIELEPDESTHWHIVADVAQDHVDIAGLRAQLAASANLDAEIEATVRTGAASLAAKVGASDGLQQTGDARAAGHHAANVLFNVMRGGVFAAGYRCSSTDFRRFIEQRNRSVAERCSKVLDALPAELDHRELVALAGSTGDPDLERLALEYLPLMFSRRHGDPSRPWNRFSIQVRESDGSPLLHYEGNWRDIFQNWEALCLSFPEYLPSMVSVFVNATTADGFNAYRITRDGIEWEVPDPDDPWSNIGYWGDHQIIYLLRLLEMTDQLLPGTVDALLQRRIFTYVDVPYRLKPYEDLLADPRSTIDYDEAAAEHVFRRAAELGGDGKLLTDPDGNPHRVCLLEKLVVPALSKLSAYVPGGGIWMNTQRPEWNDANNALAGFGLSMVTLYYLRRYLQWLMELTTRHDALDIAMSAEVADWLADITAVLEANQHLTDGSVNDHNRARVMGELGRAFAQYRSRIYAEGITHSTQVRASAIRALCAAALPHLDATIAQSRRKDGLYEAYNLVQLSADLTGAAVEQLSEMLEGQVAVLSSGVLTAAESADVIDALYASALYRPDQNSFMLYPDRRPPPFVEKNVVPDALVTGNPLFAALLEAGNRDVIAVDVDGIHRFSPELSNASDLHEALDRLASHDRWLSLVTAHRSAALDTYEAVFNHHAFTGRSGTMYAYEGLGSIYWHMVAKLLVATQECLLDAHRADAATGVVDRLRGSYFRVRSGIGFNKTAAEYGAVPIDPYSHTPAHAGAQQPGMTGQVKEEILTRLGELGIWFEDGELSFDPLLLRTNELLAHETEWSFVGVDGLPRTRSMPAGTYGLTVCQVPVIVSVGDHAEGIEVVESSGNTVRHDELRLSRAASREIFLRSGAIDSLLVRLPSERLICDASAG